MALAIYARENTAGALSLTGGEIYLYSLDHEPAEVLGPLLYREDLRLILVEEEIAIGHIDYFRNLCMVQDQPLIVTIPAIESAEPLPSIVMSMVNRALGLTAEGGLSVESALDVEVRTI